MFCIPESELVSCAFATIYKARASNFRVVRPTWPLFMSSVVSLVVIKKKLQKICTRLILGVPNKNGVADEEKAATGA